MAPRKRLGPGPAYGRIVALLRSSIAQGRLAAGAKLPSERDLATRHGVSLMTARRALVELDAMGLVTRRIGSGTYVAPACGGARRLRDPHEEFHARVCRLIAREPEWIREWWDGGNLVVEERIVLSDPQASAGLRPLLEILNLQDPYAVEEIRAEDSQLRIRQTIYNAAAEVMAVREMFIHGRTLRHGLR